MSERYSLRYRRDAHERYWIVEDISWYGLQAHLEQILKMSTETEILIIIKKESD